METLINGETRAQYKISRFQYAKEAVNIILIYAAFPKIGSVIPYVINSLKEK
jgi:hypothetical protein